MSLRPVRKEFRRKLADLREITRLGARHRRPQRADRQFQPFGDGLVVEVAMQPVADQPAIPGLEHGPGADADVPQLLEMARRRDRLGLGAGKRLQFHRAADGFFAHAFGTVEVGHEVADHAGQVDRERAAALPELQRAEAGLQQTLEEGLKDVVDILPSRPRTDAVIDQAAVAMVERVDRTRGAPQDIVDQFDI